MADATAESLLGGWKREKKAAEVEGIGTIYYYDPPTVAERDAFQRHITYDEHGRMSFTLMAIVDGVLARVKDANGRPLFRKIHRSRLIDEMPQDRLLAIWQAIGGDQMQQVEVEAAEKK